MTRLALLADVHGNAFALQAVLNDVRAASPDAVYNLGDTVWGLADPARAWALQQEHAPPTVRGNTDERVAGLRAGKEAMRSWLSGQLSGEVAATLAALPTSQHVADGEVLLAHGTPTDPWQALMLSATGEGDTLRPATFRELRTRLDGAAARVCVVGHTHREMLAVVGGVTVINTGPVSRPKDGSPLARWLLLTRRHGHWSSEFRRVPYDVAAAAAWARSHGPAAPGAHEAQWLTAGREP